jgi:hypothetical protein
MNLHCLALQRGFTAARWLLSPAGVSGLLPSGHSLCPCWAGIIYGVSKYHWSRTGMVEAGSLRSSM